MHTRIPLLNGINEYGGRFSAISGKKLSGLNEFACSPQINGFLCNVYVPIAISVPTGIFIEPERN